MKIKIDTKDFRTILYMVMAIVFTISILINVYTGMRDESAYHMTRAIFSLVLVRWLLERLE